MTTAPYHSHIVPQDRALEFITAGNSTFTFKSLKTGNWFTYKAEVKENFGNKFLFIKLMNGHDNENSFSYLCHIKTIDGVPVLKQGKSKISKDAKSYVIFDMVFYNLLLKINMPTLEIWHEGRCCRCGRKLTVPESIEYGIGPECAKKENQYEL